MGPLYQQRWKYYNRSILVFLIILSVLIITLYYRGNGRGALTYTQRFVLTLTAPVQKIVTGVVSPLKRSWSYVVTINQLHSENQRLTKENALLRRDLKALRNYRWENKRLKKLVGFKEKFPYQMLPARVIGYSPSNWQKVITIDRGQKQGVKKDLAVVTDEGLVGRIVEVTSQAAQVELISDRQSGVAAEVKRTGEKGVIEGRVDGNLVLKFIPKDAEVKKGDKIITSGVGQTYPRNLLIGVVREVQNPSYAMEKIISVKPAVNLNKLEEVLILLAPSATNLPSKKGGP